MEIYAVLIVICAAYVAGSTPIDQSIKYILQNAYGERAHKFAKTIGNMFKGFAVVFIAAMIGPVEAQFAAFFVFLGHIYPIRNFKGGNGMATLLGTMIALHPVLGLVALFSWLFTYFVFRYSSLAAVMSAIVTTTTCHYIGLDISLSLLFVLTAIVVWRHREGLARIKEGTEEMVIWD